MMFKILQLILYVLALLVSKSAFCPETKSVDPAQAPMQAEITIYSLAGNKLGEFFGPLTMIDVARILRKLDPSLNKAEIALLPTSSTVGQRILREYSDSNEIIPSGDYNFIPNVFSLLRTCISGAAEWVVIFLDKNRINLSGGGCSEIILDGTEVKGLASKIAHTVKTDKLYLDSSPKGIKLWINDCNKDLDGYKDSRLVDAFTNLHQSISSCTNGSFHLLVCFYPPQTFGGNEKHLFRLQYNFPEILPPAAVEAIMQFLNFAATHAE